MKKFELIQGKSENPFALADEAMSANHLGGVDYNSNRFS
jgi:hypothetical protein